MPTTGQRLGTWGEKQVCRLISCPISQRRTLHRLSANFPSLDVICRECGAYLAQVKTVAVPKEEPMQRPQAIRGAGWRPLQLQIALGELRDLYVVGGVPVGDRWRVAWIDRVPGPALFANASVFRPRVAHITTGSRTYEMFDIRYSEIPSVCILTVHGSPPE